MRKFGKINNEELKNTGFKKKPDLKIIFRLNRLNLNSET